MITIETIAKPSTATVRHIVDLTKELIRFKSTHDRPDEIRSCARFIAAWFETHDIPCRLTEREGIPSVVAPAAGRHYQIVLMSHIDVVNATDDQFDPIEKDGRLYGRGAIDDKYAAALSMVLLRNRMALTDPRQSDDDRQPLGVLITGDEEIGGASGARSALAELSCDFCIALDGGRVAKIVVKEKGVLRLIIIARGKTAHGARPWLGVNAIERLMDDCRVVSRFFDGLTDPNHWHRTMNLSVIRAGESINQVPDRAEAIFDIRYTEKDDVDALIQDIRSAISGDLIVRDREPLFISPESTYLDRLLALTPHTRTGIAHGASDARFLTQFDIPGIVWGANGNNSQHAKDEHVEIESMARLYGHLDRFMHDLGANPV